MDGLTLKQIRYFEAVARHQHFGHAAEACAISQPALSIQIKELEQTLGLPLFERGPRHVRLTRFGVEFADHADRILRAVDEVGAMTRAARQGLAGRMRIGVIPTIAPYLLPRLIPALTDAFPDLQPQFRETITSRLIEELQSGVLDTAIVALPVGESGLEELPLFSEDLVLVRPASAAEQPLPTLEDISDMHLLLLEEGHCFRDQALAFCNIGRATGGLDGTSLSTLVQMVGSGLGVTLIPDMAVPIETRAARVSIARFADPVPKRTVGMVWRKTNPLADQLRLIADVVRNVAAQPSSI